VKYGCIQDDCNAAKTTALVLFSDQAKGRVDSHRSLHAGLKSPCAFRMWIYIGLAAHPTDLQRGEEKNTHTHTDCSCLSMTTPLQRDGDNSRDKRKLD